MKARLLLFSLLLLALPLSGFGQSTLNFPRLLEVGDAGLTGLAVVNPSASAATVTFTYYTEAGSAAATKVISIPARNSFVGFLLTTDPSIPQLFDIGAIPAARGWFQATSTTTGLQGFWLGGDFDSRMDGAETSPVGQEFIFPLATADTELSLVNLSGSANTLTIRLYGSDGAELTASPATQGLPSNGAFKARLNTIFTTANFDNARSVKVTGTGNFTGTTVIFDFIHAPSWSVINGINTSFNVTDANYPHVPSGSGWTSIIGITNFSTTAQTVTISYNGRTEGRPALSVQRTLPARGSLRESAGDLFTGIANGFTSSYEDGWVKVTGSAPLGGFIAFGYDPTDGVAVVPLQPEPATAMIFSHVAQGPVFDTGLALLNSTTTDAVVEVYVMRKAGDLVGGAANEPNAAFTIPAGTKAVRTLDGFVPAAVFDDGFVYMRSVNNVPLYGFQLFYRTDGVFKAASNVAAGAVHPSITFTPPPPPVPLPTPVITSITPGTALRGAAIVIAGTGFSGTAASNTVTFSTATGSVNATPTVATTTSLTVTVPATAITGPVFVTSSSRFSNSSVLVVGATATTQITNDITVNASQNTLADIYVSAPAGATPLNGTDIALTATSVTLPITFSAASVDITRGATMRLWVAGDAVSSSTTVEISGSGVTVSPSGHAPVTGAVVVHLTVAAGAATGPRNIILTNSSNLDTSIITGGLIVR